MFYMLSIIIGRITLAGALTATNQGILNLQSRTFSRLPSFRASGQPLADKGNIDSLEREGRWWFRVGDEVYHAPPDSSDLSTRVEDYYLAVGSKDALTEELRKHWVGSHGTRHIFHLPQGPSLLGNGTGARRSSFSALMQLSDRAVVNSTFPTYTLNSTYVNPLTGFARSREDAAVAWITTNRTMTYLQGLLALPSPAMPTRSWTNADASTAVQSFLRTQLASLGYTVCLHEFNYNSLNQANVLAFVPGTSGDSVIVGAHYDSRPYDGLAPGAVDNGSGVASVLAIADGFRQANMVPTKNIYFAFFAAEETGLVGSTALAAALSGDAGSIAIPPECRSHSSGGVVDAIIMDEVAWQTPRIPGHKVNLESYANSTLVLEHLAQSSNDHNGASLELEHSSHPFGSDHMPFLTRGHQAVLTIHADDEDYPNYHTSNDNIANVNATLMTLITRMNMGALLRLSAPLRSATTTAR